jgi:hypothetical protein
MAAPLTADRLEIDWQRDLIWDGGCVADSTERSCAARLAAAAAGWSILFGRTQFKGFAWETVGRGISCSQVMP